jgi:hypothetical protein
MSAEVASIHADFYEPPSKDLTYVQITNAGFVNALADFLGLSALSHPIFVSNAKGTSAHMLRI